MCPRCSCIAGRGAKGSEPRCCAPRRCLRVELGKSLLVLDTASAEAERLYARLGWVRVGVVPDYALLPGGGFCATTFFYRRVECEDPMIGVLARWAAAPRFKASNM